MREALFITAMLATLAATRRAGVRAGALGLVGGCLTIASIACGAWLDVPSPLRGAAWLYGIALLGKTLALGRAAGDSIRFGRGSRSSCSGRASTSHARSCGTRAPIGGRDGRRRPAEPSR